MARPFGTKKIETPELMWELFEKYQSDIKDNPIIVKDWVGAQAVQVYREKERPLTMEGFENFVFSSGFNADLAHYFAQTNESYKDYFTICSRIKQIIRQNQIEGGMAGIYNPSITQRLNNLVEKTQSEVINTPPLFPDVPKNDSNQ